MPGGAENIDLVTPTHFLPDILPALSPRLSVPVVYNCGGYERAEILRQLEGSVDIYLPDLKYAEARLARSLSGAADYFPRAKAAIREMVRQTGPIQWQGEKVVKGVIIRHLILPGHVDNSLKVLDWIGSAFAQRPLPSIMMATCCGSCCLSILSAILIFLVRYNKFCNIAKNRKIDKV